MARISIQACLTRIPNSFDLTLIAVKRARQLARGAEPKLPWNGHKSTVLALQEIADGYITTEILSEPDLPVVKPDTAAIDAIDPHLDLSF